MAVRACIYRAGRGGVFRWAGDIHSFMLRRRIDSPAAGRGITVKGLKRSGMVDLLGMFRRRPAKRGPAGFARSREDITALGDTFGDMLTSPVRDAPPMARAAPLPGLELPQPPEPAVEPPRQDRPRRKRPAAKAPSTQDQRRRRARA